MKLRSGSQVIEEIKAFRRNRAKKILETRAELKEVNVNPRLRSKLLKHLLGEKLGPYWKLRPSVLYNIAVSCLRFSKSNWGNPHSNEYYSACGYDDYQWELRQQARRDAIEYFRAWKFITGKEVCHV